MNHFSVLLPIYYKDNPQHLAESLDSIVKQTLPPDEVVIVKDGILTGQLEEVIKEYCHRFVQFNFVQLPTNIGLGNALKIGLEKCKHNIVARMDADDIAHPDRFQKQVMAMAAFPGIAAMGCNLSEFNDFPNDTNSIKKVPSAISELKRYAMMRNPLNHPSVIFRKSAIEAVGSYKHMPFFEDYYLWLRLLKAGHTIGNLDESLVYFRVGNAALTRRHGTAYIKSELNFYKCCLREKLIPGYMVLFALLIRLPIRILPKKLFLQSYKTLLRK